MARSRVDIRFGPELLAQIEAFRAESQIPTVSAAARALVTLGLEKGAQLDASWRKVAWNEAMIAASGKFKEALAKALDAERDR